MIKSTFRLGSEVIETIIDGTNLIFSDMNGMLTTIEGLRLDKSGVLKEFPDLENNEDWRHIAIQRLKEHLKELKTEAERNDYVIKELIKSGYTGLFTQRAGFRTKKIKIN